jgi:hypothetical protein
MGSIVLSYVEELKDFTELIYYNNVHVAPAYNRHLDGHFAGIVPDRKR